MGKQVKEVSHKKNILSKAKKLKQLITGKVNATPQNEAYPYGSQSLVPIKCLQVTGGMSRFGKVSLQIFI